MTVEQLQAGYNRFTKDYYRMMEIVYRAFKQPNAVATITPLITCATLMLLTVGAWPAIAARGDSAGKPDVPVQRRPRGCATTTTNYRYGQKPLFRIRGCE